MSDSLFSHPVVQQIWQKVGAGQIPAAEQQCKQLLQQEPQLADAWFLLADIAIRCNQLQQAEQCLQQCLQLQPDNHQYQFALANLAITKGQDSQAYALLRTLLDKTRNYEVWLAFARCCWRLGYYQDSVSAFELIAKSFPEHEQTVLPLARALCSLGEFTVAAACLKPVIAAAKHSGDSAQLNLHLSLTSQGPARSLDSCLNWLKIFPQHPGLIDLAAALELLVKGSTARKLSEVHAEGLQWLTRQPGLAVWCGLPVEVLFHAMQQATEPGLWIEAGVFHGRSIRLLAQANRPVQGFDSFQGLPEDWKTGEKAGSYSTQGRLPQVPEHVTLHQGWFEHTLPTFIAQQQQPVRLLHIDCDLYSSTKTVLQSCAPLFVAGTVIVFDDFIGYPEFAQHELKAFEEFCAQHGWQYELIAVALLSREVAIKLTQKG